MGFRFSWEHANWLAHILQPSGPAPQMESEWEARESLKLLLDAAPRNFYGSKKNEILFKDIINNTRFSCDDPQIKTTEILGRINTFFRDTPWTALLVPSGDKLFDEFLCSRELLQHLIYQVPTGPGFILQLDRGLGSEKELELNDLFPAFRIAMASATKWPGVLLWTRFGDAAFFEITKERSAAAYRLEWLFAHTAEMQEHMDLPGLQKIYKEKFPPPDGALPLRLLHISDLHLGANVCQRRLPRVKQLIQNLTAELGENEPIVPVVTGDLMDTPGQIAENAVRDFIQFLTTIGSEEPVLVLGNHDVRKNGWLNTIYESALGIPIQKVRWFDSSKVVLACFNSAIGSCLARGRIDDTEFMDIGTALDQPTKKASYIRAALLHHHPVAVTRPAWYRQSWYERVFPFFQKTDELENSRTLLDWSRARNVEVLLHGHKHIPRVDTHDDMMIVGCGSTTGKVETQESGTTYMSINVVTIDYARDKISSRLLAERIPGAGFTSDEQHEAILTSSASRHRAIESDQ